MTADGARFRLVTRGDDAGVVPSANAAIRDAYTDGLLRNASVMAPADAVEDAADRLADLEGLCVGQHLTVTSEWDHPRWEPIRPARDVPSLVDDDGHFHASLDEVETVGDIEDMVAEARAQLDHLRTLGFDVSYLDTHQFASRIDPLDAELATLCEREGLVYADRTAPVVLVENDLESHANWLAERLVELGPGTYAVVGHPGYVTGRARRIVGLGYDAPGEVARHMAEQGRLFTDPAVEATCDRLGAVPVRYIEL